MANDKATAVKMGVEQRWKHTDSVMSRMDTRAWNLRLTPPGGRLLTMHQYMDQPVPAGTPYMTPRARPQGQSSRHL